MMRMIRAALFAAAIMLWAPASFAQTGVPQTSIIPTATQYTAGNCLGNAGASAVIATTSLVSPSGTTGSLLVDVSITDTSGQDAPIDFLFLSSAPTGTYTDHSACQLTAADSQNVIGRVSVTSYVAYGTPGVGTLTGNVLALTALPVTYPTLRNLWVIPVVQGTPTYGASKTLYLNFGVVSDVP